MSVLYAGRGRKKGDESWTPIFEDQGTPAFLWENPPKGIVQIQVGAYPAASAPAFAAWSEVVTCTPVHLGIGVRLVEPTVQVGAPPSQQVEPGPVRIGASLPAPGLEVGPAPQSVSPAPLAIAATLPAGTLTVGPVEVVPLPVRIGGRVVAPLVFHGTGVGYLIGTVVITPALAGTVAATAALAGTASAVPALTGEPKADPALTGETATDPALFGTLTIKPQQ